MSFNGSGTFQINSTGQPVVSGAIISSTVFNALTADLATGLTTTITKNGQTTTTTRIPFAVGTQQDTITELTSAAGVTVDGTLLKDYNVILSDSSSVTKKATFSMASITAGQTRTWTFPDLSDTFVGLTATQTLTNKTLTSPTLTTPVLGVATATSLAIAGATIGTHGLAITGTANISGAVTTTSTIAATVDTTSPILSANNTTAGAARYAKAQVLADETSGLQLFQTSSTYNTAAGGDLTKPGNFASTGQIWSNCSRGLVLGAANGGVYFLSGDQTTVRVTVGPGLQIGTPTGGDKGAGTINVAADIYKNNTAYTNPDYVLEHWATGKIETFKDKAGAADYSGLMPLSDLKQYARDNFHLPRFGQSADHGIFSGADALLAAVEEAYLYIFDLQKQIDELKKAA